MFTTVEELKTELLDVDPNLFVSRYILESVPHVFGEDLLTWLQWKSSLATDLEVDPHEMVLTGSAAVGFSLNPNKGFKQFDGGSDIDVAIISPYHFEIAWRWLRRRRIRELSLQWVQRVAIEAHRRNYIYWGTIATDRILQLLPFAAKWMQALSRIAGVPPTVEREVKVRVYRDFDALRGYQVNGIRSLRDQLLSEQDSSNDLPIGEDGNAD